MQNKKFQFGPVAISNVIGNLLNPPTVTGGVNAGTSPCYILIDHIRIVNRTAAAHTFQLYRGVTGGSAAGTEVVGFNKTVAANDYEDYYGRLRFDSADFLTGIADAASSLVITGEGEIGVAG